MEQYLKSISIASGFMVLAACASLPDALVPNSLKPLVTPEQARGYKDIHQIVNDRISTSPSIAGGMVGPTPQTGPSRQYLHKTSFSPAFTANFDDQVKVLTYPKETIAIYCTANGGELKTIRQNSMVPGRSGDEDTGGIYLKKVRNEKAIYRAAVEKDSFGSFNCEIGGKAVWAVTMSIARAQLFNPQVTMQTMGYREVDIWVQTRYPL